MNKKRPSIGIFSTGGPWGVCVEAASDDPFARWFHMDVDNARKFVRDLGEKIREADQRNQGAR